jgi:hypothetical protein
MRWLVLASNPGTHPGFTLAEDAALKYRLSDMAVSDDKNPTRVADVFYRHPVKETEKSYPYVTIELLDINHATDRQHSMQNLYFADATGLTAEQQAALTSIDYIPSESTTSDLEALVNTNEFLTLDSYTPVDLMYQATTYCRANQHDRQLTALMLRRIAPFQGRGWVEIPEDGTIRRLDIMDWRSSDILDGEAGYKKRIFRKVYTLVMNSELLTSDYIRTKRALTVEGVINGHTPTLSPPPFTTEGF